MIKLQQESLTTKYIFPLSLFTFRGIAKAGEPNNISPLVSGTLFMDPTIHATLRRKQRRLVRENPGVLAAIAKGANMAITECQHQFRNRRWNCSTRNFLRGKNLFGKIVDKGKWLVSTLGVCSILTTDRNNHDHDQNSRIGDTDSCKSLTCTTLVDELLTSAGHLPN